MYRYMGIQYTYSIYRSMDLHGHTAYIGPYTYSIHRGSMELRYIDLWTYNIYRERERWGGSLDLQYVRSMDMQHI